MNLLVTILMYAALAAGLGDVDRTHLQTQDQLKDGSCVTCPCK